MQQNVEKQRQNSMIRVIVVTLSILTNVLLFYIMLCLGLPLCLDTVGTIFVSMSAGPFFGTLTAVITNTLCMFINGEAIYYSAINTLVAISTYLFFRRNSLKRIEDIVKLTLIIIVISGTLSTFVQWGLGIAESTEQGLKAWEFSEATGVPYIISLSIMNLMLNAIDKSISVGLALLIRRITPEKMIFGVVESTLKQSPLAVTDIQTIRERNKDIKHSVRARETISLIVVLALIVSAMAWIGLGLYFKNEKNAETRNAYNAAQFAAEVIDTNKIDEYLTLGEAAPGYLDTKKMLSRIRKNATGVQYLYVTVVKEDGFHIVFNLGPDTELEYASGDVVPFMEDISPYIPDLLAGEVIEPIESNSITGWVQTVYYPLRNINGKTVCYIGCDVSLQYMAEYMTDFIIRVFLMLAGLFIMLISYVLWATSVYTTYPLSSMTAIVDQFSGNSDDQQSLDENVRKIRALDIHTGDEIEKLYQTLCDMTLSQTEQMRNIRRLSESTMKMQDGLIITMADMVENRDSDTGAHVQKTAAYVKIIVEGLKKKGYYPEKISPKFMSDVVRSAPLHDVGKINISDRILNKPGKLTEEEFEIMKTHTTAGKEIMEKAISTFKGGSYLKEARNMAAYHHERWDGKGYPEGLHGEVIPLSARIMAVADVFDALTSRRVYKPPFTLEQAIEILQEGSGSQFDPKCVEVFLESISEVKVILNKYNQT